MLRKLSVTVFLTTLSFLLSLSVQQTASAQVYGQTARARQIRSSSPTIKSGYTKTQHVASLPRTKWSTLGHVPQVSGMRNGLPPTHLDSFVLNAGAHAELIYGDESEGFQPPPYDCFTEAHRINTGIRGERNVGLTTGHGSYMPSAWGRDEFSGAPEFSQSGERDFIIEPLPYKNEDAVLYRDEQFPNGYQVLDKKNQLDEDRPQPDPDTITEEESGF